MRTVEGKNEDLQTTLIVTNNTWPFVEGKPSVVPTTNELKQIDKGSPTVAITIESGCSSARDVLSSASTVESWTSETDDGTDFEKEWSLATDSKTQDGVFTADFASVVKGEADDEIIYPPFFVQEEETMGSLNLDSFFTNATLVTEANEDGIVYPPSYFRQLDEVLTNEEGSLLGSWEDDGFCGTFLGCQDVDQVEWEEPPHHTVYVARRVTRAGTTAKSTASKKKKKKQQVMADKTVASFDKQPVFEKQEVRITFSSATYSFPEKQEDKPLAQETKDEESIKDETADKPLTEEDKHSSNEPIVDDTSRDLKKVQRDDTNQTVDDQQAEDQHEEEGYCSDMVSNESQSICFASTEFDEESVESSIEGDSVSPPQETVPPSSLKVMSDGTKGKRGIGKAWKKVFLGKFARRKPRSHIAPAPCDTVVADGPQNESSFPPTHGSSSFRSQAAQDYSSVAHSVSLNSAESNSSHALDQDSSSIGPSDSDSIFVEDTVDEGEATKSVLIWI